MFYHNERPLIKDSLVVVRVVASKIAHIDKRSRISSLMTELLRLGHLDAIA